MEKYEMTTKSIEERAKETLEKRIRGSFGFRAADSILSGYNAEENVNIYKAHGGTRDELATSLELAIERAEPTVSAADIAKSLDVDAGEAKEILDEQTREFKEMQENKAEYLATLQKSFDKAKGKYDHISSFSADNITRVVDNLVRSARKQFIRSKNSDWARAVQEAATPVLEEVIKKATPVEQPSDKVAA